MRTRKRIGTGRKENYLYYIDHDESPAHPPTACPTVASAHQIYCRLGHPCLGNLKLLFPSLSHLSSLEFESCQLGKHNHVSFASPAHVRASSPFSLFHYDVWGHSRVTSTLGFRYFLTFVNDFSRVT